MADVKELRSKKTIDPVLEKIEAPIHILAVAAQQVRHSHRRHRRR